MNQRVTQAIILTRVDFGEADRILTFLTPDHGKLTLMAKGVRRVKSKLAGGIELFSISTITFVRGRGSVGTLISARLVKYYSHIVNDLDRTMQGYDFIKQVNKITEDQPGPEYFRLLEQSFAALDDASISLPLVHFWFLAQVLRLNGHAPNLRSDTQGQALSSANTYDFDQEKMCFAPASKAGSFDASDIKFLRLGFSEHSAKTLTRVQGSEALVDRLSPILSVMFHAHLHY